MRVIAIIPAYNEEGKIGLTVKETRKVIKDVVVVDDDSKDNTYNEAKNVKAILIKHNKNKGAGAAIRTGLIFAKKNKFDICVILGGDNQDKPSEIPLLLDYINRGYDFVQGSRYIRRGNTVNIPLFRKITTIAYSIFFKFVTNCPITDGSNGFRAFRLSILDNKRINIHQKWLDRYELEPYLFYMAIKMKYKVIEAPVTKKYPKEKETGYTKMVPFLDWWRITKPLIYLKLRIKK